MTMKFPGVRWFQLAIAALVVLCVQRAGASTVKVGSCALGDDEHASAQFSTIQAAVNAAAPGSRVLVCPGTYAEQVEVTKPLTLTGAISSNSDEAIVVAPPTGLIVPPGGVTTTAPQIFVHDTQGPVTVSNLTVDGANSQIASCTNPTYVEGVYFLDASGEIENVFARNQVVVVGGVDCGNGVAFRATGISSPAVVSMESNTASLYDWGIFASYPQAKVTIRHNSLLGQPGTAGMVLFFNVDASVSENAIAGSSDAALFGSGIDVVGVNNAVISENHLAYNGYGITFYTFQGDPNSDSNTVTGNDVFGSDGDAIAICGGNNVVRDNTIAQSAESGVNLVTGPNFGAQCTSVNNTVSENTINGACAGILIDPAAAGNSLDKNRIINAANLQLTGTSCVSPLASRASAARRTNPRLNTLMDSAAR
jgi:hypothetical protein